VPAETPICHRDYSIGGGSIGVALYDDRLEVTSSGTLHFGLTPAALFEPHESLPWNPLVASVFYRRGIIETWGRGTLKMAELAEGAGLPRPEIEEIAGAVMVRFGASRSVALQPMGDDLTERQQALLAMVAATPKGVALREMSAWLEAPPAEWKLKKDLALLRQLGLIAPRGHGRGAVWVLVRQRSGGVDP
jgi:ATP-dependent DNA helicase RecG